MRNLLTTICFTPISSRWKPVCEIRVRPWVAIRKMGRYGRSDSPLCQLDARQGEKRDGYQVKVMNTDSLVLTDVNKINCDLARYAKEYMPVSSADAKLLRGMRSNLKRTFEIKPGARADKFRLIVSRERWLSAAQGIVCMAVKDGSLPSYSFEAANNMIVPVTVGVAKRIIASRGRLPDVGARLAACLPAVHSDYSKADRAAEASLHRNGVLSVRKSEFESWYKEQKKKGTWPSQAGANSNRPRRRGRPEHDHSGIEFAVRRLVDQGIWDGQQGVPKLWRLLKGSGTVDPLPSQDTLARFLRKLDRESNDFAFQLRIPRRRRTRLPHKSVSAAKIGNTTKFR